MSRLVFYNAGPPSATRPEDATRDWSALLREFRPRGAIGCEVVGDKLQPQPGWFMVRDSSRASRANLVGFVREDCQLRRSWWIDHRTTWTRPKHPQLGLHPPRSSLVLGVGELQLLGAHNVPMGTDATRKGQAELVEALQLVMTPWTRPRLRNHAPELSLDRMRQRPRVVLWDDNAPIGSNGLGADILAHRIAGTRHGRRIDNAVSRKLPVTGVEYVTHAAGRKLATDHPWGAVVVHVPKGAVQWQL